MDRGILETIYFRAPQIRRAEELLAIYEKRYAGEPFVRLYDPGNVPDLRAVQFTNFCDIGLRFDPATKRAVVVSCIDNLGKGAAGQLSKTLICASASRDGGAVVRILVKLGGTLLDAEDSRRRLAEELTTVSRQHELVVVHGGGKQMTRFLAERGLRAGSLTVYA